eukprot:COSAG06_NODE_2097_length_7603_cov_5.875933_5_plen_54_part_00
MLKTRRPRCSGQTIFSNIYAFPSVYGPSCLWVGQWAKDGYGPHMYNDTCCCVL